MNYIDRAITKYADLVAPIGLEVVRDAAMLVLDGTPCNESRGWYGDKPGCERKKSGSKKASAKSAVKPKKALKPPTKKLLKMRKESESMGQEVGAQRLTDLRRKSTTEEQLHEMLKRETAGIPKTKSKLPNATTPDGMVKLVNLIDRDIGSDNYVPIYEIIQRSGLPKKQVVKTLYELEKSDRVELGGLQEQKKYTPEQIELGAISREGVGGMPLPPIFFVSLSD